MTEIVISDDFECSNDRVREALSGRDITEFVGDEYLEYLSDDVVEVERGEVIVASDNGGLIEVDLYVSGRLTVGLQRGEPDHIEISDDTLIAFGLSE